ncbi:MAG: hypothetical protein HZC49_05470 [Nitrospirae bacterium]|nr:hypothetical protein [Nitrospirota bacterium]
MKKDSTMQKTYAVESGKLHLSCPHKDRTGINVHVVVKDGFCYRSEQCMVIWCKFNRLQTDLDKFLSLIW